MLGYCRVRQYQEILFRLFTLRPYVMEKWSFFAEQILDIIENGSERFPGIARNGVINRYVENVPGFLCPDSRAGSYSGAR
jgi:hypothetical protein